MNESAASPLKMLVSLLLALAPVACGKAPAPPLAGAAIGGPFTLVDQNGRTVSDRDFAIEFTAAAYRPEGVAAGLALAVTLVLVWIGERESYQFYYFQF